MSACILAKNMPNSHFTSLRGCHFLRRHFVGSMLHQFYDIMVGARSFLGVLSQYPAVLTCECQLVRLYPVRNLLCCLATAMTIGGGETSQLDTIELETCSCPYGSPRSASDPDESAHTDADQYSGGNGSG
jgi:hypothetical protein